MVKVKVAQQSSRKHLRKPEAKEIKYQVILWEALKELFFDYAENSKFNGMYYLRRNKTIGLLRLNTISIHNYYNYFENHFFLEYSGQ